MDTPNSTVAGNMDAIADLLAQGGIGNVNSRTSTSNESALLDIEDFVVLFHGDLGTGERIAQILKQQAIETTPWNWYQFVIYVFGLFHLKMACADAIWRIFILPLRTRLDPTSVMGHVGV